MIGSAELKANGQATGCCYRPDPSVRPDPDPSVLIPDPSVVAEGSGPDGTGRRGRHRRSGSSVYSRKFDLTDPYQFRCPAALWVPSVARRRHQKRLRLRRVPSCRPGSKADALRPSEPGGGLSGRHRACN